MTGTTNNTAVSPLLTTDELATALKLSLDTIRQMARSGVIPSHKFKRQWRFDFEEVKHALKAHRGNQETQ